MATFVQAKDTGITDPASPCDLTFDSNVTGGNQIIVCVALSNGGGIDPGDVTVADDDLDTYTLVVESTFSAGVRGGAIFINRNATAGAKTVTATSSGGTAIEGMEIAEYSGLASTNADDEFAFDSESSPVSSPADSGPTPTTGVANGMVFGCVVLNAPAPPTGEPSPGSGFTERAQALWNFYSAIEDRNVTATGAYNADWTYSGTTTWIAFVVFFADASQAGQRFFALSRF